jgi:predicted kinase
LILDRIFEFNPRAEVDRFFNDSSLSTEAQPTAIILAGAVATGKTTLRNQKYSSGYVLLDAGKIFLNLSHGEDLSFPGPLTDALELVGRQVTRRALSERRNIITEITVADDAPTDELITALAKIDYHVKLIVLTCAAEETARRNADQQPGEGVSAFFPSDFTKLGLSILLTSSPSIRPTRAAQIGRILLPSRRRAEN